MKKLTRIEAWKLIRKSFRSFGRKGFPQDILSANGLCFAIAQLHCEEKINVGTFRRMDKDIKSVRSLRTSPEESLWYWPCNVVGTVPRVKAINVILKRLKS